ncbi:hypothetical protein [Polluticoccus soli]|uniref:hypothetical protein n=1 Tax=Polluticoccus soli TaxID=3034150 RepID=UPI0023E2897E|nr:hypothetical protein [Flavipsychrobacter sp. JY13-12]
MKTKQFAKELYRNLPTKIVNQLSYTEHFIVNKIEEDNWFEDIANYIDYNNHSFGHPGIGQHVFENALVHWLKGRQMQGMTETKRDKLLGLFKDNKKDGADMQRYTDINLLVDIYNRWLKTFPFELTAFSNLRAHFDKTVPILSGRTVYNPYLGTAKARIASQDELLAYLVEVTKKVLGYIDSTKLIEKGTVSDIRGRQIEVVNESHRIRQNELLVTYNNGESQYVQIIKKWLQNEKSYFKELALLLTEQTIVHQRPVSTISVEEISTHENAFWKGIPIAIAAEHFMVLTRRKSKNGRPYLTETQFSLFLQKAFLNHTYIPKQTLNFATGEKGFIIKRFYEFYELAVTQYNDVNRKLKYIKLVTDCFDNWDQKGVESYFKPNKTKQNW